MDWLSDAFDTLVKVTDSLTALGFAVTFLALIAFGVFALFHR